MGHSFFVFLQWLYWVTLLATCGYAAVAGGRDERDVAATHVVASCASTVAIMLVGPAGWLGWQPAIFLIDLAALAAFSRVAMRSGAFWPLWVTGFHLDAVLTHLVRWLAPVSLPSGYSILQGFWAYPLMAALVIGTRHHRRQSRHDGPFEEQPHRHRR